MKIKLIIVLFFSLIYVTNTVKGYPGYSSTSSYGSSYSSGLSSTNSYSTTHSYTNTHSMSSTQSSMSSSPFRGTSSSLSSSTTSSYESSYSSRPSSIHSYSTTPSYMNTPYQTMPSMPSSMSTSPFRGAYSSSTISSYDSINSGRPSISTTSSYKSSYTDNFSPTSSTSTYKRDYSSPFMENTHHSRTSWMPTFHEQHNSYHSSLLNQPKKDIFSLSSKTISISLPTSNYNKHNYNYYPPVVAYNTIQQRYFGVSNRVYQYDPDGLKLFIDDLKTSSPSAYEKVTPEYRAFEEKQNLYKKYVTYNRIGNTLFLSLPIVLLTSHHLYKKPMPFFIAEGFLFGLSTYFYYKCLEYDLSDEDYLKIFNKYDEIGKDKIKISLLSSNGMPGIFTFFNF